MYSVHRTKSIYTLYAGIYNAIISTMEKRSAESKAYKLKYNAKYKTDHYKRIPLDVTFDKYEEIKAAADKVNESVNGYIKKAIDQRIDSDK